jgi:serine-type D-Ala-D-Ala carboxypeptidase/endopeptidase (penicillin-binding protein 4)
MRIGDILSTRTCHEHAPVNSAKYESDLPRGVVLRMIAVMRLILFLFLALGTASPVFAKDQPTLPDRIAALLGAASPGSRFGLVVTRADGTEIVAINADGRFIPASNTKIVTTAAAFMTIAGIDQPDVDSGASVHLEKNGHHRPDVVLTGRGDARLSSAPGCVVDCLATLVDAVATSARRVHNVIGDDCHFADERWSPGMSWNNIPTRSGTATSALTLDDNEIAMIVTAGAVGARPTVDLPAYYTLDNQATTVAAGPTTIGFDREPNRFVVRLTGVIAVGAAPERLALGIDDPAYYAAWRFAEMLVARGVKVKGGPVARHLTGGTVLAGTMLAGTVLADVAELAAVTPPPLIDDLAIINKTSQNLHAELLLRRLGAQTGAGSIAGGLAVVGTMFERAGLTPRQYAFSDGGGMSTYNRIAPRGMVRLLRWIAVQPWGQAWRAILPVGGEGMLARRFGATALAGKVFAKTGTLNATAALSGYLIGASGQTLTFASFANDVPDGDNAGRAIDAALMMIAAES